MILIHPEGRRTGGSNQIPVWRVTAGGADQWEDLLALVQRLELANVWGQWPTQSRPWDHLHKGVPHLCFRREQLVQLVELGAVDVPPTYWAWAAHSLRRELWLRYWRAPVRDGGAAAEYWRRKLRWLTGQVVKAGEWVTVPELAQSRFDCDRVGLTTAVKTLNNRIEIFDLGQRKPVNPGKSPDFDREAEVAELPTVVRECMALPAALRAEFQAANQWAAPLFARYGQLL